MIAVSNFRCRNFGTSSETFPALVSNHVVDLVSRYKPEELPEGLIAYVQDRESYNYLHHCEVGSSNADFVSDEIVDRFCISEIRNKTLTK